MTKITKIILYVMSIPFFLIAGVLAWPGLLTVYICGKVYEKDNSLSLIVVLASEMSAELAWLVALGLVCKHYGI
jgi:hypothetical protein